MKARLLIVSPVVAFVALAFVSAMPSVQAVNIPKFLVSGAIGCTTTNIFGDADCWSLTSGGLGGAGIPDNDDTVLFDANSGAGTVNSGVSFAGVSSDFTTTGYLGTFIVDVGDTIEFRDIVLGGSGVYQIDGIVRFNDIVANSAFATSIASGTIIMTGNGTVGSPFAGGAGFVELSGGPWTQTLSSVGTLTFPDNSLTLSGGEKIFVANSDIDTILTTSSVTLSLTDSTTMAITNPGIGLDGTGGRLTLRSVIPGLPWNLIVDQGTLTALNVTVSDSNADLTVDATDCSNVDAGGNTNWNFDPSCTPSPGPAGLCDLDDAIPGVSLTELLVILIGTSVLLAVAITFVGSKAAKSLPEFGKGLSTIHIVIIVIGFIVVFAVLASVAGTITC